MGDKPVDGDKSQPSLELPSLFGGRKKSRLRRAAAREDGAATETREAEPQQPTPEPTPEPASVPATATEQPAASDEAPPATVTRAPADPESAVADAPAPAGSRRLRRGRRRQPEASRPEPAEPVAPAAAEAPAVEPAAVQTEAAEPEPAAPRRARQRQRQRQRQRRRLPGPVAAPLTGVLVGLFGAGLTYASLGVCEAVRGTTSCGGPGLFVLVLIVVLMIVFGALLLHVSKVPEPRSTSFLAVGVTVVVILVTLMEELFSSWMFLAVPAISAAAYSLAHWVTTRYVELPDDGPQHDVR